MDAYVCVEYRVFLCVYDYFSNIIKLKPFVFAIIIKKQR